MAAGVTLRDMAPGEGKALQRLAKRAFSHSPMEAMGVGVPKAALVAEVNGAVAGAMFLRVFEGGGGKTGYLDVGFVAREYRGQGVGRVLYPAATKRLEEMGCDIVTALVIDDNAASWKSLENQGFGAPSLTELLRFIGPVRGLSLWLRTAYCFAGGTRLWAKRPTKKRGSPGELFSFLWVNLVLFLPALLHMTARPQALWLALPALAFVLLFGVGVGFLGCLAAGGAWRFSLPRGGALLTLLLNALSGFYPMVGRWYPTAPQPTAACRRALGVQAAVEWLGMLLLCALGAFWPGGGAFLYRCAALAVNLLVYRLFPFMPFGAFGGARVWGWSKPAFAVLAGATILLLYTTTL